LTMTEATAIIDEVTTDRVPASDVCMTFL